MESEWFLRKIINCFLCQDFQVLNANYGNSLENKIAGCFLYKKITFVNKKLSKSNTMEQIN